MKVLQLCHKPPLPAVDGGCIAMNNITSGLLKAGVKVKLLTVATVKHPVVPTELPDKYLRQTKFEAIFVDTKVNMIDAFSSLITQDSYNVSRFFSPDFDRRLSQILKEEKFDIVHIESLFMTPYIGTIRRLSKAKIVMRSHNLEYVIWERMAKGERFLPKRAYLRHLSKQLKLYELSVVNDVDGIATISSEDEHKYRKLGPSKKIITIPFGVDLIPTSELNNNPEEALFHLGSMDWGPNLEGILWFMEKIWPGLNKQFPNLKLYLGGRNFPEDLIPASAKNVICVGEVESAPAFIQSKAVMIVPLLSAGGIRVKIIEGMAMQKAIISTSIGAEGIDYKDGHDIYIADHLNQFKSAIQQLLYDPKNFREIGQNARKLAKDKFENTEIIRQLIDFYNHLLPV